VNEKRTSTRPVGRGSPFGKIHYLRRYNSPNGIIDYLSNNRKGRDQSDNRIGVECSGVGVRSRDGQNYSANFQLQIHVIIYTGTLVKYIIAHIISGVCKKKVRCCGT